MIHVIVGPERHGVVRHGLEIAAACGHRVVRLADPAALDGAALDGAVLDGAVLDGAVLDGVDVVHVPFTDRLFGETIEAAVDAFTALADHVARCGAMLSVTLHDVPHDDSVLQRRRRAGYRSVSRLAHGVVVNSELELSLLTDDAADAWSVRLIRLPVFDRVPPVPSVPSVPGTDPVIGVLGFVFPDRGYRDVVDAAPPGSVVRAVGQPASGHDRLVAELTEYAQSRDITFEVTGYVDDADLPAALAEIDVPIAPNRRVTASASINTWATHGRRVLVPDSPYVAELLRDRTGRLVSYADDQLPAAIAAAVSDPFSTRLAEDVTVGPTLDAVAAQYRRHLDTCRPPRALPVAGGWTVPGNRWDLLAGIPAPTPEVSVVVPYYLDQAGLDRLLAALVEQTHPATRLQIIVADDGSPHPPDVRSAGGRVLVVRQDDRGFRAAAARNLGVAAADGDLLVFLDGDMAPEPDFVEQLCALPAVAPDAVTVGRRRHADLTAWSPADVTAWARGGRAPDPLPEPAWLADAYAGSRNLLDADLRSYRYVISAVLALRRDLYLEVGGFDESFTRYGGEDWELAHRLWVAGALLAHCPDAVAWHDGPDWAGRLSAGQRDAGKAAERAALAAVLPDPVERGAGRWEQPAVLVRLVGTDVRGLRETVGSAGDVDCGFWHADPTMASMLGVHVGQPAAPVLARSGFEARVSEPVDLGDLWTWCLLADRVGTVTAGPVRVESRRHARREARHGQPAGSLAGRHDRSTGQSPYVAKLGARTGTDAPTRISTATSSGSV